MRNGTIAIIFVAIAAGMTGCKSPLHQERAGSTCTTDEAIQIAALSNQVSLLSQKVDSMEQERQRVEPLMRHITQLLDEQDNRPIVQAELVWCSTNETKYEK
jgi:hypothetical protein